ncbi:MAG: hypothetical protein WDA14_03390 [Sphaerochaetaceae bacterium]
METADIPFDPLDLHFEEWKIISDRMKGISSHVIEQTEKLQEAIQPIIEVQNKLQREMAPFLEEQNRLIRSLQSFQLPQDLLPDMTRFIQPALDLQRAIQEKFIHVYENLHKTFRELPPRTQEALLLLGEHGWYLDMRMPLPGLWELKQMLSDGEVAAVEELLCEYYEDRIDKIEESIMEKYPNRQKIIKAAFNAHRKGEYELSIPVLLAQTDGICKEVFDEYYFIRTGGKPKTAIYVEKIASDTYKAALLSPLARTLPIGAPENRRPAGFSELNRHMVLHGESLDYGTKVNSLKAISLINYIAHVLSDDN